MGQVGREIERHDLKQYLDSKCGTATAWREVERFPDGLRLDSATGVISGTPMKVGNASVTIRAWNELGEAPTQLRVDLIVRGSSNGLRKPCFKQSMTPPHDGVLGQQMRDLNLNNFLNDAAIELGQCGRPNRWELAAGNRFPDGISLNPISGVISGTPKALPQSPVIVQAINDAGSEPIRVVFNFVSGQRQPCLRPNYQSQYNIDVGQEFYRDLKGFFIQSELCGLPSQWEEDMSWRLPGGLRLDSKTGEIRGTPSVPVDFGRALVRGRNAEGMQEIWLTFNIRRGNLKAPCFAQNPPPVDGIIRQRIEIDLKPYVSNGCGQPTVWSLFEKPMWLNVDTQRGIISGTPDKAETLTLRIYGKNAVGDSWLTLTLNVRSLDRSPCFTQNPIQLPAGRVNELYKIDLKNYIGSGCGQPRRWQRIGNVELQDGLTLNPETGIIEGIPRIGGVRRIEVRAVNDAGARDITIEVNVMPKLIRRPCFDRSFDTIRGLRTWHSMPAVDLKQYLREDTACGEAHRWRIIGDKIPWLVLDEVNGILTGVPDQVGNQTVRIRASNSGGDAANDIFITFEVSLAGPPPCYSKRGESLTVFLPSGLRLVDGKIAGTPLQNGVFEVNIYAADVSGKSDEMKVIFRINPSRNAPCFKQAITEELSGVASQQFVVDLKNYLDRNGYCGQPTEWRVVQNVDPREYMVSLPSGLQLDSMTGVISGFPQVSARGSVLISARNERGNARLAVRLNIGTSEKKPCFVVRSIPPWNGTLHERFPDLNLRDYLQNNGQCGQPTRWEIAGGNLHRGLQLHPQTGVISGTPSESGLRDVIVAARNSADSDFIQVRIDVSMTRVAKPCFTVDGTTVNGVFERRLEPRDLSSFLNRLCGRPTQWRIVGRQLPAGLELHPVTGILSGTPVQVTNGMQSYTATAGNSAGEEPFILRINVAPPRVHKPCLLSEHLPALEGIVGRRFTEDLRRLFANNTSCSLPDRFRIVSTVGLPRGLVLEPSGLIHGVPEAATRAVVTVLIEARNAADFVTFNLRIVVYEGLVCLTRSSDTVEGTVGVPIKPIDLNGYVRLGDPSCGRSDRWEEDWESSGSPGRSNLPKGLFLNNGVIQGTPESETFRGETFVAINRAARVKLNLIFDIRARSGGGALSLPVQRVTGAPKVKPLMPITARVNQPLMTVVELETGSGPVHSGVGCGGE